MGMIQKLASKKLLLISGFISSLITVCALPIAASAASTSVNSAVAIMYHRFGEDEYPTTNIRVDQFKEHIAELKSGKYTIMRLIDVMEALQAGKTLPDRTVTITIDDAFASVYSVGWPMLKEANLPFTLFMATGPVDHGQGDYMTWQQIREMASSELVDIAGHSQRHSHLPEIESQIAQSEIATDHQRITEEIGVAPTLFAYPYGETSLKLMEDVKEAGYIAAFGQQSGAITAAHNQLYLPRFPVNERYGAMDRFIMSLNAVGLAATDHLPKEPLLRKNDAHNPPAIGFTIPKDTKRASELVCYHSQDGKIEDMQHIGNDRIELRFKKPFGPGRTRVNCTLPAGDGRWYWYGMQYYTKK